MLMWIRRLLCRQVEEESPAPSQGQRDASAALDRAKNARARLRAQRPQVQEESRAWRVRREQNHFAELIINIAMGGGKK